MSGVLQHTRTNAQKSACVNHPAGWIEPNRYRERPMFVMKLSIAMALAAIAAVSGCRTADPVSITFDQLEDGDFVWDRVPTLIPGRTLSDVIGRRVTLRGQWNTTEAGEIVLSRPQERWLTPTRIVICASECGPLKRSATGQVSGVLRLHRHVDSAGRLDAIYRLEHCSFSEEGTGPAAPSAAAGRTPPYATDSLAERLNGPRRRKSEVGSAGTPADRG